MSSIYPFLFSLQICATSLWIMLLSLLLPYFSCSCLNYVIYSTFFSLYISSSSCVNYVLTPFLIFLLNLCEWCSISPSSSSLLLPHLFVHCAFLSVLIIWLWIWRFFSCFFLFLFAWMMTLSLLSVCIFFFLSLNVMHF